jgi:hypothetical protein
MVALQKLPPGFTCLFRFETPQTLLRYHESRTSHRMVKQSPKLVKPLQNGTRTDSSFPKAWTNFDNLGRNLTEKDRTV